MKHQAYETEIGKLHTKETKIKKRSNLCLYGKLLFFASSVIFGYFSYSNFCYLYIMLTILSFAIYITLCILDNKYQKNIKMLQRLQTICNNEIAYLNGNFDKFDSGDKYIDTEHEFSYDLDIFGKNSLFNRINRCITQKGRDKLASKLTQLCQDKQKINDNQMAITELSSMFEWRIKFMANPYIADNFDGLARQIANNTKNFFIKSTVPYILIGLAATTFLLGLFNIVTWHYFSAIFSINLICSLLFFRTLSTTNVNAEMLHKEFAAYLNVLKDIHNANFKSNALKDLKHELFGKGTNSLDAFKELSQILNMFDQRGNAIIYLLLNGTILFDIILVKKMMSWSKKHLSHIQHWFDCIAELDALVSFGNYAYNNPDNTTAEILPENTTEIIQTTNIYHPFLTHRKAVPNNFTLNKNNIAIVTGANMAGKSTFLRAIGTNYILACNGAPVCAQSFKFAIVTLFSSMRTTDDLSKDISYFNAELLRLKQLILHIKSHHCTLIILDEILKGTNSKDKLNGSIIFLREISKYNIAALIATHDLELAKLAEENGSTYSNYRFEIELSNEIKYTYKLEKGIAQNLNASYLLSNMLKST